MSDGDAYNSGSERIETEVIDPDAPVRFLRVTQGDEELAMIPWEEAEIIAEAVERYNMGSDREGGGDG